MASYPPPPPGYGGPPPGSYGGFPPTRSTNGKAIAALVCGICAFVVCPLTAIAAVVLGPQAKREIAAQPDRFDGAGMALAGQILGWVMVGLIVVGIGLVILLIALGAFATSSTDYESLAAIAS